MPKKVFYNVKIEKWKVKVVLDRIAIASQPFYRIAKFAFDYATKNGRKKVLLEQYMKIFKYI